MKSFTFHTPTKIEFGKDSIDNLPAELEKRDLEYPLIVSDKGLEESGNLNEIKSILGENDFEYEIFSEIEPNPKDKSIEEGVEFARNNGIKSVIGFGGGSPMDAAKLISMLLTNGGKLHEYIGVDKVEKRSLPLVTIPTTSGTGSEVTFSAVFTDTKGKIHSKESIRSHFICPDIAIVDPKLTISMPPELTAATGFDALTHAIEAYTSKASQPITDRISLGAIEIVTKNISEAVKKGKKIGPREAMSLGSLMAGISFFNSDVTAVHCLSEALGGFNDIPHGVANAVLLPYVMEYNIPAVPSRFADIAEIMNSDTEELSENEKAEKSVEAVKKLSERVGLPKFRDLDIKKEDFEEISKIASDNVSVESNPRKIEAQDFRKILEKAYSKK